MCASLVVMVMSSSFFNPSFAFSSQFDSDGAPLSELSWSSSLAVVAVSFSGLFTFIFLMLACLCCKKGDIGFKEFDNAESEDYRADLSTLGSPASQGGPEVYILPLTEVSLPVSKQPGRSVQLLKSTDLGRQSLLYLKEIGHGWFGKVLLGEVNAGLSTIQVVVKELKASASVQHQMQFLEEAQPYRALQHPALLQCLAQCSEVTPYLLVMEFCPLGDLKGYLRSCLASDSMTPDPLILQRMACEITSGLLHLHKHNYIHSDLALRNCLLTAEVTVKIGDYGLSHNKYKEDYFVTTDQLWVPLRWIAPELVDEVHGNLLVVDHTKPSNVWSLGVTIWELFELGNQPYRHYSDRQVLTYAVKEQQLKLPKPLMKVPLSERWYEVMQFCWLQPDQRPTTEEVHLLLSYLCAKGASGAEEDFEKRWNSLRPNGGGHCGSHGGALPAGLPSSCSSSSFPLLERFSAGDGYHSEPGDDILTVTETSQGLNFEYKWEQARPAERPFCSSSASGPLGQSNPHYQDVYYPAVGMTGGCRADGLTLGISPSYYEPKHLHAPGVVPVLSAHSPSVSSEYYIRIEEPVECAMDLDYTMCAYSPGFEGSNGSFLTGSGDSGECVNCASEAPPSSYWSADGHKTSTYDSDTSPAISLTMEPLLGQESSPVQPWEAGHYVSYKDKDGGYYYEHSPSIGIDHYLMGEPCEPQQESWGSRSLRQALGELENPLGVSPSLIGPEQGYIDPYLEGSQGPGESVVSECYYDMMGSLRKAMPIPRPVGIDIETGAALFLGRGVNNLDEEDPFIKDEGSHWTSNHSANNNSMNFPRQPPVGVREAYADLHYTMPSTDVEDSWPRMKIKEELSFVGAEPLSYLEAIPREGGCMALGKHCAPFNSGKHDAYIYLCHEVGEEVVSPVTCLCTVDGPNFIDPLSGAVVRNYALSDYVQEKAIAGGAPHTENKVNVSHLPEERLLSKAQLLNAKIHLAMPDCPERQTNITPVGGVSGEIGALKLEEVTALKDTELAIVGASALSEKSTLSADPNSESSQTTDSGVERGRSSISLVDIGDCSDDDDITDVTSGIFVDFPTYYAEAEDPPGTLKPLQKQAGTPDSVDSIDLPSAVGPREAFSPNPFQASSPPKAMDSGYDTENNESPEFVLKEPHEPRDSEGLALCGSPDTGVTEATLILQTELDQEVVVADTEHELTALREKDPYRDSAYFSDYDTDSERFSHDKGYKPPERLDDAGFVEQEAKQKSPVRHTKKEDPKLPCVERKEQSLSASPEEGSDIRRDIKNYFPRGELSGTDISAPVFSTLSPSPPEMGGCLTKESSQDEGLGLDSEHSGEEPSSECSSSSTASGGFPDQQMPLASGNKDQNETGSLEDSLAEPLVSDSTSGDSDAGVLLDIKDEEGKEQENSEISMNLQEEKEKEVVEEEQQKSQEALSEAEETQGKDGGLRDIDMQAALEITDIDTSPSLSSPPPVADGDEADSEDSEGSDEELRCYNVQEQSEDSEEEFPTVPIIVSDCSEASRLRSLLKMPTLLTQSFCSELDRKKKAVSFFDDVTVYLFDQESPTRELAEQGFLPSAESCGQGSGCSEPSHQEKANAFDDSSDGNVSEESGGFEWEDDFPLLSSTSSITSAPTEKSAPTSQSTITPETAPSAQYSRFTVSRFSITHVSDSDVDSVGGSSEDGERE